MLIRRKQWCGVLPVAFALVESGNTSSWSWFMSCIREGVTSRQGLCVKSDRHGGIMATMNEPQWSPPNAYNCICVHHFESNFNTKLNKYFNTRRYRYDNTDSAFAPKVHERLEELRERAQFHRVVHFNSSQGIYQVTTGIKHHLWKVCLPKRTFCKFTNREYSEYVPHEYTLEAYNMTWSYHFSPLPHSDFWEPYDGLPHMPNPHFKRTNVGRNPTRRRPTEMDQRDVRQSSTQGEASSSQPPDNIQRCKLCHQTGHNRRSFPFANAS
ncbi:hypothetical protein QQ045_000711 [Rhodiola kirilowii]